MNKLLKESKRLKKLSINEIINFVSKVSQTFLKSKYIDEISKEISKNTDYSEKMIKTGLRNAFYPFQNKNNIKKLLRFEIHDEKILDKWIKINKNIYLKAFSPHFIHAIFSGNIPGIEIQIIFPALLSKTCIYAKPSYKMSLFLKKFKEYLTNNFRNFPDFFELEIFKSEEKEFVKKFLKDARILVIQGNNKTIEEIKGIVDKRTKIIEYPTMFGAGVIKKRDFSEKILKNVAFDIFLYNHRGCMSPFVIFLENGIDFNEFSEVINSYIQKFHREFKGKEIDFEERVRRRQITDSFLFEENFIVKDYIFKFVKTKKIIDIFFPGIVQIVYYKNFQEIIYHLYPFSNFIQSFALSSPCEEIIDLIAEKTSCIRITEWGRMQFPPLFFPNKGSFGIKQFLKFCVREL